MTTSGTTERADALKGTVADKSGQVAGTAKDQAREVATEATDRARDLAGEAREQVRQQTDQQRDRLAGTLHQLGDELRSMADQGQGPGIATELARQAGDRVHGIAGYVEQHQPGDVLDEIRDFARRRPGTFVLGALAAGVLAGRLTRGVKAAVSGGPDAESGYPSQYGYASSGYAPGTTGTTTGTTGGYQPTPPPPHPVAPGAAGTGTTAGTTSGTGTGPFYDEEIEVVRVEVEPEDSSRARGELP